MPVILTQNISIELGSINGTRVIFRQLVYQADSVAASDLSEEFPLNMQYMHQLTCALVEISHSNNQWHDSEREKLKGDEQTHVVN